MNIYINITNKKASLSVPAVIVCGNSDYSIEFSFDEEWEAYDIKTARFYHGGNYTEVVFTGNTCDVPILSNASGVYVGVYAGDLHTTTPAYIPCEKSILCMGGGHEEPEEDVYNQLMQTLSEMNDCIPVPPIAEVGQTIAVKEVDENGKPTEWEVINAPIKSGEFELLHDITTTEEVTEVRIDIEPCCQLSIAITVPKGNVNRVGFVTCGDISIKNKAHWSIDRSMKLYGYNIYSSNSSFGDVEAFVLNRKAYVISRVGNGTRASTIGSASVSMPFDIAGNEARSLEVFEHIAVMSPDAGSIKIPTGTNIIIYGVRV